MLRRIAVGLTLVTFTLPAQTPAHKTSAPPQSKASQSQIDQLSQKVAELEKRVNTLEGSVALNKALLSEKQDKADSVVLDPSSREFLRLDSETSTFMIALTDASPYLNGYRIKMNVGNPSDAKFSDAKLKVTWGRAIKASDSYSVWLASLHEKEVTLTEDLLPGAWNPVSVDLIPCAPNELGYLVVSLETPSVLLRTNGAN